jgi:tripartite-type tricarboxylate transporter receptor subunit TctC
VRIIIGYAAAGSTDITGRLVGQWLSERLGQQFVVENRPGAGSNVGTELVVRAPPDGYTLLLVNTANAINATPKRAHYERDRNASSKRPGPQFNLPTGTHPGVR